MRRTRIIRTITAGAAAIAIPLIGLSFCVGDLAYYADKMAPAPASRAGGLHARPGTIFPEHQTEPNTCGYHSLSAIYTAYGLDPEALRLRFRLGVDKPVNTLIADSTGAIHPDILRVLDQDGFDAELVRPSSSSAFDVARGHLTRGHPIAVLIRTSGGGLHWVVASEYDEAGRCVRICDSLWDDPYTRPAEVFLTDTALSLILVRPALR